MNSKRLKEECQQFVDGVGYVFLMMLIIANFPKSFYIFSPEIKASQIQF
jgi:hypothetical protein